MTAYKFKEKVWLHQAQLFHQRHIKVLLQTSLPTPPQPYGHELLRDREGKRSEDRLRTRHRWIQEMHPQQLPPDLKAPSLSAQQTCSIHCPLLTSRPAPESSANKHQIPGALLAVPHCFCPATTVPVWTAGTCTLQHSHSCLQLHSTGRVTDHQSRGGGTTTRAERRLL